MERRLCFCPRFSPGFPTRRTWRTRAVQIRRIRSNSPFDRWWFVRKSHVANSWLEAIVQYRLLHSASNIPAICNTPVYSVAIEPLPGQHLHIALETLSPRVGWSLPKIIRATTTWGNMLNHVWLFGTVVSPLDSPEIGRLFATYFCITLWPRILVFFSKIYRSYFVYSLKKKKIFPAVSSDLPRRHSGRFN